VGGEGSKVDCPRGLKKWKWGGQVGEVGGPNPHPPPPPAEIPTLHTHTYKYIRIRVRTTIVSYHINGLTDAG
jgi:formylmethanofuran dehydrogenase subunit A